MPDLLYHEVVRKDKAYLALEGNKSASQTKELYRELHGGG